MSSYHNSEALAACVALPVGDINSDARGSGARYNAGKPTLDLLPIYEVAVLLDPGDAIESPERRSRSFVRMAMMSLGEFQADDGDPAVSLRRVLQYTASAAGMTLPQLIEAAARVFDYGREKYAEWNWAKGMNWSVPIGCAARHLLGTSDHPGMWDEPSGLDHESGLPIAGHVACNALMLLQYLKTYRDGDDRPRALADLPF